MNEQLSIADLTPRQASLLPVVQWRKLLSSRASRSSVLAVGHVLANHADKEGGSCWPSLATIMDEAIVSKRTALRALAELEETGLLYRRRRGRTSNSYRLLVPVENPVDSPGSDCFEVPAVHVRGATRAP